MSGTASELKFSGLVNTGPLRRPSLNESCSTDFSLPITPEINLENESINVNAANSPPLKIKSPTEISSSTYCDINLSSMPSYLPQMIVIFFSFDNSLAFF